MSQSPTQTLSDQQFLQWLEQTVKQTGASTFSVTSPANGQEVANVVDSTAADAQQAVERSVTAFHAWRDVNPWQRAQLLLDWYQAIMAHQEAIGRIISLEMGKPVTEAKGEVAYAAAFVQFYAEEAKRIQGETFSSQFSHKRLYALRTPVGPVYAITPWNFPAAMITRKVAPALAAGCTAIVKPAPQSPLTALFLGYLWEQVGGPADALITLTTQDAQGVSQAMFDDERIRKLTFTGSTEVGRQLYQQAAKTIKKVSLELGGHAPYLVFDDADLDQAVEEVVASKFRNAGQTCVCTNRIYVQSGVADAFTEKLVKRVSSLVVGDPGDAATEIGPLVDAAGLKKVQTHVRDALDKGAEVKLGGDSQDLYFQPTVLTGVKPGMQILEEETFGPVAPVIVFDTEEEAVTHANNTPFGLAAYAYTNDLRRSHRVSEALEYGIVGVNDGMPSTAQAPFGGVKNSGLGREGGQWGLDEFLDIKYVSVGLKEPAQ